MGEEIFQVSIGFIMNATAQVAYEDEAQLAGYGYMGYGKIRIQSTALSRGRCGYITGISRISRSIKFCV